MSSSGINVLSIKWFKKKNKIQKAINGFLFEKYTATAIRETIKAMAGSVLHGLKSDVDNGMSWISVKRELIG
jgi:hypothetical protein